MCSLQHHLTGSYGPRLPPAFEMEDVHLQRYSKWKKNVPYLYDVVVTAGALCRICALCCHLLYPHMCTFPPFHIPLWVYFSAICYTSLGAFCRHVLFHTVCTLPFYMIPPCGFCHPFITYLGRTWPTLTLDWPPLKKYDAELEAEIQLLVSGTHTSGNDLDFLKVSRLQHEVLCAQPWHFGG